MAYKHLIVMLLAVLASCASTEHRYRFSRFPIQDSKSEQVMNCGFEKCTITGKLETTDDYVLYFKYADDTKGSVQVGFEYFNAFTQGSDIWVWPNRSYFIEEPTKQIYVSRSLVSEEAVIVYKVSNDRMFHDSYFLVKFADGTCDYMPVEQDDFDFCNVGDTLMPLVN